MHPTQEFTKTRQHLYTEVTSPMNGNCQLALDVEPKLLRLNDLKSIAAGAVTRDAKLNGVIEQLQAVAASLEYTKLTFAYSLSENIEFLKKSHCGTNMLWLACDFLSLLIPLDLPSSKIECTTYLNVWRNQEFHVYLIDSASLKVVPISKTDALALAAKQPVFSIDTNHIVCGREIFANIEYHTPNTGRNFKHYEIKIKCHRKPSQGTISVLLKMGSHIKKPTSFIGVVPIHVTVEFNGECLDKIIRPPSVL